MEYIGNFFKECYSTKENKEMEQWWKGKWGNKEFFKNYE